MEQQIDKKIDVVDLVKALWTRRKMIVKWGVAGLATGVIVAISMPREYSSSVTLISEASNSDRTISGSLGALAGMAGFSGGADQDNGLKPAIYPDLVASTPFISEFANMTVVGRNGEEVLLHTYLANNKVAWWSYVVQLPRKAIGMIGSLFSSSDEGFQDDGDKSNALSIDRMQPTYQQQAFISAFSDRVFIDYEKKTNFLTISVTMQDPIVAVQVADSVSVELQRYITMYNTSKSRDALDVTQKLFDQAKENYLKAEYLYAETYDRNQNLRLKKAEIQIEQFKNERNVALAVYDQLAQKLASSKLKVHEDASIASIIEPAKVAMTPRSPKKVAITLACTILAMFIAMVIVVFKVQFRKAALAGKDE